MTGQGYNAQQRRAVNLIWAAAGALVNPCTSFIRPPKLASGEARSSYFEPSAPFSIFSKPTASAHSTSPPRTACAASISADEPVEQLLFTLKIGMPVSPTR